ncbi:MAG: hypothetical protein ABWY64_21500 [Tardiphaga sp.]
MTEVWGIEEQRAYGEVRRFIAACVEQPRNKPLLRRLSGEAHKALHRIERLYHLPLDTDKVEHP